jgi:tetrahydromethanopterin S-methyltransferase subunit G
MKKSILFLAISVVVFAFACNQAKEKAEEVSEKVEETTEEMVEEVEETSEAADSTHFGELIDESGALTIDEFAAKMNGKDSLNVKIAAVASEVCQKKGCWMKVQTADGSEMRIKFKDYGFFVPKDISGKQVVFEGVAFQDTTSVEDLKHYAEDAGKSKDEIAAISEPEIQTAFTAHGVMIK